MQKMFVIHYYINNQILDSYLHIKSEKLCADMSDKISGKFHPIPSTLKCSYLLVVSMATVAILKILKVFCTSTHSA